MSARTAAREAGISEARWRQIASGYQTVSGTRVPVTAPAETLARMARVVGVTPPELEEAGREDAATELRALVEAVADTDDAPAEEEDWRIRRIRDMEYLDPGEKEIYIEQIRLLLERAEQRNAAREAEARKRA